MKLYKSLVLLAYDNIEQFIKTELEPEGLLSDVKLLINTQLIDDTLETPLIWIDKGTIEPGQQLGDYGRGQSLQLPISFICVGEEQEDIAIAEQQSYSIALRVVTSILQNYTQIRPYTEYDLEFTNVTLNSIEPAGTFEIINKRIILPATRVNFTFEIYNDWMTLLEYDTDTGEQELVYK